MAQFRAEKSRGCLLKIRGSFDSLKTAERRIAQYICEHPSEVVGLTINELVDRSKASYTSVSRFCKKMGYVGFKELKADLANDIIYESQDISSIPDVICTIGMSAEDILQHVYASSIQVLEDCMTITDLEMIDTVVNKMLSAHSIHFIGTGFSGLSAQYACTKFFRIGLPCIFEPDTTIRRMRISLTQKDDLVFAISSSGRSKEIVECARIAKKCGASVVSLSDFTFSALSKVSDWNLYTTPRNMNIFMNIDMPLTIGQLMVLDTIYVFCCRKLEKRATERYHLTQIATDEEKL